MAVVIWVDGAVKLLGFVRLKVRTEDYLWLMSDNQCPMTDKNRNRQMSTDNAKNEKVRCRNYSDFRCRLEMCVWGGGCVVYLTKRTFVLFFACDCYLFKFNILLKLQKGTGDI